MPGQGLSTVAAKMNERESLPALKMFMSVISPTKNSLEGLVQHTHTQTHTDTHTLTR